MAALLVTLLAVSGGVLLAGVLLCLAAWKVWRDS